MDAGEVEKRAATFGSGLEVSYFPRVNTARLIPSPTLPSADSVKTGAQRCNIGSATSAALSQLRSGLRSMQECELV